MNYARAALKQALPVLGLVALPLLAFVACKGDESTATTAPAPAPAPDSGCVRTDLDAPAATNMTGQARAPRWAFEPWISKDISNRDDTYAYVDGFRDRSIPVGAVVLDSPWETHYNTFVPNPSRYGDFPGIVRDMHARNVRVVLWITSLVNEQSFDFENGGGDLSKALRRTSRRASVAIASSRTATPSTGGRAAEAGSTSSTRTRGPGGTASKTAS